MKHAKGCSWIESFDNNAYLFVINMQYHMSNDSIQLQFAVDQVLSISWNITCQKTIHLNFAVDQVLLISGHDLENKKNAA